MLNSATSKPKPIRYCEHVREQGVRPYRRLSGPEYDLIICWQCQSQGGQLLAEADEIVARLRKLVER